MYLPHIKNFEKATRQTINVFGGYNHTPVIGENEFYHMENMTSDTYPALSARRSRTTYNTECDCIMWVGGIRVDTAPPYVRINKCEHVLDMGLQSGVEHSMVVMGAYVLVFPEGVYVNTMDTEDRGELEDRREIEGILPVGSSFSKLTTTTCDQFGKNITVKGEFDDDPKRFYPPFEDEGEEKQADGSYWYCKRDGYLYRFCADGDEFLENAGPAYTKIQNRVYGPDAPETRDWVKRLRANDLVSFKDFPESMAIVNGTHALKSVSQADGYVVIEGYAGDQECELYEYHRYDDPVTHEPTGKYRHVSPLPSLSLVIPPLDYVIVCNNRLWGCRYGEAHNGEFVNEIYATELGDFRRWYFLADDSKADNAWIASIGHTGAFTGAVSYGGRPYFFKQDRVFAVYGEDATTFGYTDFVERGVQAGCDKSLCVLDGVLYYKALDGIVAFDGSSTSLISSALGAVRYKAAVGGGVNGKYYVSMTESGTENPSLFVYDARRGLWHREDGLRLSYATTDGSGYLWGISGDTLCCINSWDDSELVPWMAETGIWGLDDPDKKYVSRISLRLSLDVGAYIKMSIQYDSVGDFEQVLFYEGVNLQTLTLPVTPRRCDHMRIRLEGIGNVRIYSITKTIEGGSDQ